MDNDRFHMLSGTDESNFRKAISRLKYILSTSQFWMVTGISWILFCATLTFWTYGYLKHPALCISWTLMIWVLCAVLVAYHSLAHAGTLIVPIAVCCLVASMGGSVLGLYCYDTFAIYPLFYNNARSYTNVVASEPSQGVSDAGKLIFNVGSKVDVDKSTGYIAQNGDIYCVAPVRDRFEQPRIEFWAAGINCCSPIGNFHCDASRDATANGGVVVFDTNGYFSDARYPFYQLAREKAEAEFFLQSVGQPLYVRWVQLDDLNYLHDYYHKRAVTFNTTMCVIFFFILGGLSLVMWQPKDVAQMLVQ